MAKKTANRTDKTEVGDAHGKTAPEQAKDARKEKENKVTEKGMAGARAGESALTPKEKAANVKHADRSKVMEQAGENPNFPGGSGSGWRTGKKVAGKQMYSGDLTLKGVSQSGHEISCRVRAETPKTEEELFYIFSKNHDSAVRDGFEIDEENKLDPMLQTPFG